MELSEDQLRELTALTAVVLGQSDLVGTLEQVTRIASRLVPGADGVSITTFQHGRPAAAAFSDPWAQGLDELQFDEREGPCLDATRTGNVFRIRDLSQDTRWPGYTERATAQGAKSSVSIPLHA